MTKCTKHNRPKVGCADCLLGDWNKLGRRKTTYGMMEKTLINALNDLAILSGDIQGPSDVSWQDVAGTAATNLEVLASMLHETRKGNCESCITFPSPAECLEKI